MNKFSAVNSSALLLLLLLLLVASASTVVNATHPKFGIRLSEENEEQSATSSDKVKMILF